MRQLFLEDCVSQVKTGRASATENTYNEEHGGAKPSDGRLFGAYIYIIIIHNGYQNRAVYRHN